jgi:hypothetical protein
VGLRRRLEIKAHALPVRAFHNLIATEAKTPREVYAALDMAREDFWQFHFENREEGADLGEKLVLAALDKALAVLKPLAGMAL